MNPQIGAQQLAKPLFLSLEFLTVLLDELLAANRPASGSPHLIESGATKHSDMSNKITAFADGVVDAKLLFVPFHVHQILDLHIQSRVHVVEVVF
mgnify:CR=1 FL=1